MPHAALRHCAAPGCPALVPSGRCPTHAPAHAKLQDSRRESAQERGYTAAWAKYSKRFRAQHPVCGEQHDGTMDNTSSRCLQHGRLTPAECVDHIVPMSQGGDQWAPANHQSLCLACNSWKAQTLERGTR